MKLPVKKKTPTGQPSTDEDVLAELALDYPLPKLILEYRGLAKLKSTYTDKLPQHGRPGHRPRAHQLPPGRRGHRPPRLERPQPAEHPDPHAEGPPHPRRLRRARRARRIVSADYSQIELRIMAHLSGDRACCDAFAHDHDVHRATAADVFGVPLDEVSARRSAAPPR